jgi:hypothetical protein
LVPQQQQQQQQQQQHNHTPHSQNFSNKLWIILDAFLRL